MLGASFDTEAENRAFATAQSFGFPLLSDTGRSVGAAYEVVRPPEDPYPDYPRRIAYLIDPEGVIRESYAVTDVDGFADAVLSDLDRLRGG